MDLAFPKDRPAEDQDLETRFAHLNVSTKPAHISFRQPTDYELFDGIKMRSQIQFSFDSESPLSDGAVAVFRKAIKVLRENYDFLRSHSQLPVSSKDIIIQGSHDFFVRELNEDKPELTRLAGSQQNCEAIRLDKKHNLVRKSTAFDDENEASISLSFEGDSILKPICIEAGAIWFPYFKNGDLFDYLNRKPFRPLSHREFLMCRNIVDAVRHIHGKGYVHRDLKLENVLVTDEYKAKLTDFEFCLLVETSREDNDHPGTRSYYPPEYLSGSKVRADPSADIWSLGISLFLFATKAHPVKYYYQMSEEVADRKMLALGSNKRLLSNRVDELFKGESEEFNPNRQLAMIAVNCINHTPSDRPSIEEVSELLTEMESRYFTGDS